MGSDDESVEALEIVDVNDVPDIKIIETNEFATKSIQRNFRYVTYWEKGKYEPTKCYCIDHCFSCRNELVDRSFCDEENCNIYTREYGICGNAYSPIHDALQLVRFKDGSYGVFNNIRSIYKSEYIGEYTGYVDTLKNYQEKELIRYRYGYQNYYSFKAHSKYTVDAFDRGSLLRFVNHSCQPNCQVEVLVRLGYFVLMFKALKNISKGTEITISYTENLEELGFVCNCGSSNCITLTANIATHPIRRTGEPSLFVNSKNKFGLYSCFLNSMLTVIGSQTDLLTAMFPLETLKPLPTIMEGLQKLLTKGVQSHVRYKLPNGFIANFELVGCTFNISTSASDGHHIGYCKDKLNTEFNCKRKWFKANCISEQKQFSTSRKQIEIDLDTEELTTKRGHITPMNIENVQTANNLRKSRAHILFYVRKEQL